MTEKLLSNLFGYERKESVGEIIFYRIFELFIVYFTIKYAWRWGPYLGRLGDVVLPLGIAEYIDITFMFKNNLGLVNAVAMCVLAVAGYLRLWRYSYLVCLLLFHLHYAARYSQGEIAHGANLTGLALLSLAAASIAFKERKEIRRTAIGLCIFFVGLAYVSAAVCKLGGTGITWPDGRHLWMWIYERTVDTYSNTGLVAHNRLQQWSLEAHWVATVILTFGLITEAMGFMLWYRRTRLFAGLLLFGMHIGIWMVMNITFTANSYFLMFLAIPWPMLIDKGLHQLDGARLDKIQGLSTRLA